ncbi:hypothetical protein [Streptomyces sviceus]|uniref:hypothetical protein n=1 Tax=Streptomyces sviceus TaxID=285530 RepID=UPI00332B07FB
MTAGPGRGQPRKPEAGDATAVSPARLRRLNRWLVDDLREDLADLYVESRAAVPGDAYRRPGRRRFLNRLTAAMRRPGFAMVIAETDRLMGCAFGFPVRGDGAWWLGLAGALPRGIEQLALSDRAFAFGDILIRPHPQDRRLARRVQERLLTDHHAALGATLVDRADGPILAALRSWGWRDAGEIWSPVGATLLHALVLPAGERTMARLEDLVAIPGGGGPGTA